MPIHDTSALTVDEAVRTATVMTAMDPAKRQRVGEDSAYARACGLNPYLAQKVWTRLTSGTDPDSPLLQEAQPLKKGKRSLYLFADIVPAGGTADFLFAPRRDVYIEKIWVLETVSVKDLKVVSMSWAESDLYPSGGRGSLGSVRFPQTLLAFGTTVYDALLSAMSGQVIEATDKTELAWTLGSSLVADSETINIFIETTTKRPLSPPAP